MSDTTVTLTPDELRFLAHVERWGVHGYPIHHHHIGREYGWEWFAWEGIDARPPYFFPTLTLARAAISDYVEELRVTARRQGIPP